jgi:FKBP12-rapamycin binding domain
VSAELVRVAILWQEVWHESLEEASRQVPWIAIDALSSPYLAPIWPLSSLEEASRQVPWIAIDAL